MNIHIKIWSTIENDNNDWGMYTEHTMCELKFGEHC